MTKKADLKAANKLHRQIAAILDGHSQPLVGTALVAVTADWLRKYHRPDVDPVQLDQWRIANLMRFLKGVAEELNLGMEFEDVDADDDDPPTLGNA